jgi:hypothetical protein
MNRRRSVGVVCLVIGLGSAGVFAKYAVVRPEGREDEAVGAAINAVEGDDPTVGTWGSCEHQPGPSAFRLRPRYDCVVRSCDKVIARLEVTDDLLDGWRFELRGQQPAGTDLRRGDTEPLPSTTITELDASTLSGFCEES